MDWGRQLDPGSFALVMATGIVSIALQQQGFAGLALWLFGFNLLAYLSLIAVSGLRWLRFRQAMLDDFFTPDRGVGFLSFVAASGVLGNQSLLVVDCPELAAAFLIVAVFSWGLLLYLFLLGAMTTQEKPSDHSSLHAGWLIIVVATQSVAILLAEFVPIMPGAAQCLAFFSLGLFLVGMFWYVILIALLAQRMLFRPFRPQDLTPPYWINMGALAITTLAGCVLIRSFFNLQPYVELRGFVQGLTLLSWAFASWWIPLLLLLGVWRFIYCRMPLKYHVSNWNIVFPLGMYTVCTLEISRLMGLGFLLKLPEISLYISLVAWLLVLFGALRQARRQLI